MFGYHLTANEIATKVHGIAQDLAAAEIPARAGEPSRLPPAADAVRDKMAALMSKNPAPELQSCTGVSLEALRFGLRMMAKHGLAAEVEYLLQAGVPINGDKVLGPLVAAVQNDQTDMVKILLRHGADPGRPDQNGWTPLTTATYRGLPEIVSLLLAAGANPLDRDKHKVAPYEALVTKWSVLSDKLTRPPGHDYSAAALKTYKNSKTYLAVHQRMERLNEAARLLFSATFSPRYWQDRPLDEAWDIVRRLPRAWRPYAKLGDLRRHINNPASKVQAPLVRRPPAGFTR